MCQGLRPHLYRSVAFTSLCPPFLYSDPYFTSIFVSNFPFARNASPPARSCQPQFPLATLAW
jgi:hypothetical protein